MKDRTSKYPGRVRLMPVDGQPNVYDRIWADEPEQEGTPLNKAALLPDSVAALLRLTQDDPTVADAFAGIVKGFSRVTVSDREPTGEDVGYPGHLWFYNSGKEDYIYRTRICTGTDESGYVWHNFISVKKTLRSVIFRQSSVWTVPDSIIGDIRVLVFGGGGSGSHLSSGSRGAGGGGGRMSTWVGNIPSGTDVPITIGLGGAASSNGTGKNGGSSAFGAFVSADGGNGALSTTGGNGGSGGGSGYRPASGAVGGIGYEFGDGGNISSGESTPAENGIDTTGMEIDNLGKGKGLAGANSSGGGGGGGFGGNGGNADGAGGGGGGFGASGNGGDGGIGGSDGGIAAGGGGSYYSAGATYYSGKGGDGIVMILYYALEVV